MELTFENSKNLARASYDERSKKLRVTFKNRSVYEYDAVPLDVVEGLRDAESAGSFFAAEIKARFLSERVA